MILYVIESLSSPPHFKIGITKDINQRRASLATGCPHKLRSVYQVEHENAKQLESLVHVALKKHRTAGEWFLCSVSDAKKAIEDCGGICVEVPIAKEKDYDDSFAGKIQFHGARLNFTQAQMANLLGVSKSTIEKWGAGTKVPKILMQEGALIRLEKTTL